MLHLKTFGGLSVDIDGTPATDAAQQRKTLALLALLAATGDRGLRRDLHAPQLFLGSIQPRLNPAVIASDVDSFESALAANDPTRAVASYTAPFLDGFYLNGGGEFEAWAETERARLASRCRAALEALAAEAMRRGA